jgi:hypothetical protein
MPEWERSNKKKLKEKLTQRHRNVTSLIDIRKLATLAQKPIGAGVEVQSDMVASHPFTPYLATYTFNFT